MFKEKEDTIREQRTIEATKKQLFGNYGKIAYIVRVLGKPIIKQSGGSLISENYLEYDSSYSTNQYEDFSISSLPILDIEDTISTEGYLFCALSDGFNLQIKFLEENAELITIYEDNIVYHEQLGQLLAYVPGNWEKIIDLFFKKASQIDLNNQKEKQKIKNNLEKNIKENFIKNLSKKWGI